MVWWWLAVGLAATLALSGLVRAAESTPAIEVEGESYRTVSHDEKTNRATVIVLGPGTKVKPLDWRPLDVSSVTPGGKPGTVHLSFNIPTANHAEVETLVRKEHPGCEIHWLQPAEVNMKAVVIDERTGRVIKELQRTKGGTFGDFVFAPEGYLFDFQLSDKELAGQEPEGEAEGVWERIHGKKEPADLGLLVTVELGSPSAAPPLAYSVQVPDLAEQLKGKPEVDEEELGAALWNTGIQPSRSELTDDQAASVESDILEKLAKMRLISPVESEKPARYQLREGLEKMGVTLKGQVAAAPKGETIRFRLN